MIPDTLSNLIYIMFMLLALAILIHCRNKIIKDRDQS